MQNYCIKYAVSKSGLTEKELLDYLVAKNTFIPIKMNYNSIAYGKRKIFTLVMLLLQESHKQMNSNNAHPL